MSVFRNSIAPLALLIVIVFVCFGCSRLGGKSQEQQVAEGHSLYEINGCATCHGAEGRGDGPVAKAMHNAPRDFRDAAAFVNGYSVGEIANTIGAGLVQGDRSMPAYSHLSADDRELLAVFVMSLRNTQTKEKKDENP